MTRFLTETEKKVFNNMIRTYWEQVEGGTMEDEIIIKATLNSLEWKIKHSPLWYFLSEESEV